MHPHQSLATQRHIILTNTGRMERDFPPEASKVGKGSLTWGRVEEIGSPAYWCAQAWSWEMEHPQHYRFGTTLAEEVLACMLGGYGIPAEVGLAAYRRLRLEMHKCRDQMNDPDRIRTHLREPLHVSGRQVRYRFAEQKAIRIAGALSMMHRIDDTAPDRRLRDELTGLPGIGLKTASWIVRNWRGSDDVCILDVHILRAGRALGIFDARWTIERHYRTMEEAYLAFADGIGARASILDSVMWITTRQLRTAALRPPQPRRGLGDPAR